MRSQSCNYANSSHNCDIRISPVNPHYLKTVGNNGAVIVNLLLLPSQC